MHFQLPKYPCFSFDLIGFLKWIHFLFYCRISFPLCHFFSILPVFSFWRLETYSFSFLLGHPLFHWARHFLCHIVSHTLQLCSKLQALPIYLGWCIPSQTIVGTLLIIKNEIHSQGLNELKHRYVFFQVNLFIFDGAPKPFNENVIHGAPSSVHADQYSRIFKRAP